MPGRSPRATSTATSPSASSPTRSARSHSPARPILKESRTTTVAELTLSVRGRPTPVIYKRFKPKKPLEWLLNLLRPTRAWRAWQAAQHLVSRGIATPQNLAIVVRTTADHPDPARDLPRHDQGRAGRHPRRLRARGPSRASTPRPRRRAIRSLTRSLAFMLRILHERSISDRDLKAANIMIQGDPSTGDARLSLIDLVGVQLLHPIPRHRRLQNLARLQVSLRVGPGPDADRLAPVPPGVPRLGALAAERLEGPLAGGRPALRQET